jgi:hypothetical protein
MAKLIISLVLDYETTSFRSFAKYCLGFLLIRGYSNFSVGHSHHMTSLMLSLLDKTLLTHWNRD